MIHLGRIHLGRIHLGRIHLGRIHLGRIHFHVKVMLFQNYSPRAFPISDDVLLFELFVIMMAIFSYENHFSWFMVIQCDQKNHQMSIKVAQK